MAQLAFINASGGNRHELHPPEYCLTGAGWLLKNEHVIDTGKGRINEMELQKKSRIKFFYHWYTDGESNFSSYKGMLTEDTFRQLQGKTTNWFLFRVIADSPQAVLNDFLTHFHGYFQQGQKEISF